MAPDHTLVWRRFVYFDLAYTWTQPCYRGINQEKLHQISSIYKSWNFMEFLVMNQKKKKISMRTEQKIQNQTNSRCKTQLWDAVAELWRNCAAAKSSTRSSAFSSSSWCPYKVDKRKREMAETSRHPNLRKWRNQSDRSLAAEYLPEERNRSEKKVASK